MQRDKKFISLSSAALWFPLIFATPIFITLHNYTTINLPLTSLISLLAGVTLSLILLSYAVVCRLNDPWRRRISLVLLSLATVLVIQGNVVNDLFTYGEFNGQPLDWRAYGWRFWLEFVSYTAAIPLVYLLLSKTKRALGMLPILLLGSACFLLAPALVEFARSPQGPLPEQRIDEKVFEFSAQGNLVHLLPDGLQSDIVKEVLEGNPDLKARFQGFVFFDNHTAQFQATAPTLPTIYNGRTFDLSRGYTFSAVQEEIDRFAYQNVLARNDYRLDYASFHCTKDAASCVGRHFNDLKARGYFEYGRRTYSYRLLADLSLFRHVPMFWKEKLYGDGRWFFSDTEHDGTSPYPDPVIREWIDRMAVSDDGPRYKFYHYVGTHFPPHWDRTCRRATEIEPTRENFLAQTYCVLTGLGNLLAALEDKNIYDQTAIVVTGDHGNNTEAYDLTGNVTSMVMTGRLIGHARPAFMVKLLNDRQPLRYGQQPTTMMDIAPTALDLVGLTGTFDGLSALQDTPVERKRSFQFFDVEKLWAGVPVPFVGYLIDGDVKDPASWSIQAVETYSVAPDAYREISKSSIGEFSVGLRLSDLEQAWVQGSEFGFLISLPGHAVRALRISLHSPDNVEGQTLQLFVNGKVRNAPIPLGRGEEFWTNVDVPLDGSSLLAENNFISGKLGKVFREPGNKESVLSIVIRSIEFL